jgi:transcriptional regulator with XRE-family HTH domain
MLKGDDEKMVDNKRDYEEYLKNEIAKNLRRLIDKRRMTQKQLSEKTGIPVSTLSEYFRGNVLAPPGNIQKIALALDVSKDDIDPSFRSTLVKVDPRLRFFEDLERELGIDLTNPKIQEKLKKVAKLLFADED